MMKVLVSLVALAALLDLGSAKTKTDILYRLRRRIQQDSHKSFKNSHASQKGNCKDLGCFERAICFHNPDDTYSCKCPKYYEGDGITCTHRWPFKNTHASHKDECASMNCHSKAECIHHTDNTFGCVCRKYYFGDGQTCTHVDFKTTHKSAKDNCADMNCHPKAYCDHHADGSYSCKCSKNYVGNGETCTHAPFSKTHNSERDKCKTTELASNCHRYAKCAHHTSGVHTCECLDGYAGDGYFCERTTHGSFKNTHASEKNKCFDLGCHPKAKCMHHPDGSYSCKCPSRYVGDGYTCEHRSSIKNTHKSFKDKCGDLNCDPKADCIHHTDGRYTCECRYPYISESDGQVCTHGSFSRSHTSRSDKDKCIELECDPKAKCKHHVDNTYSCECPENYIDVNEDGKICNHKPNPVTHKSEKDKCKKGELEDCDENAECVHHTDDTYTCECEDGFTGDGFTCERDDEGGGVIPVPDQCLPGFEKDTDGNCVDVDECAENPFICGPNASCTNTEGSYVCICHDYYMETEGVCVDINECEEDPTICGDHASCYNTPGSYICICDSGYKDTNGVCVDINECSETPSICGPNGSCTNTDGSYTCWCNQGYKPGPNGECVDIDECIEEPTCCGDNGVCVNTPGSYTCTCNPGYKPGTTGGCVDVDECSETPSICGNASCINTSGSYTCGCNPGFKPGTTGSCVDVDECSGTPSICGANASCMNTPGSYTCSCNTGYEPSGPNSCVDIDECANGTAGCPDPLTTCQNTDGGYQCVCIPTCTQTSSGCQLVPGPLGTDTDDRTDTPHCMVPFTNNDKLKVCGCSASHMFTYDGHMIEYYKDGLSTDLCMRAGWGKNIPTDPISDGTIMRMATCNSTDPYQQFYWDTTTGQIRPMNAPQLCAKTESIHYNRCSDMINFGPCDFILPTRTNWSLMGTGSISSSTRRYTDYLINSP